MKTSLSPSHASRFTLLRRVYSTVFTVMFLAAVCAANAQERRAAFANSLGLLPTETASTARAMLESEKGATVEFSVALNMRNSDHLKERVARGEVIPAEEMDSAYLPLANDYAKVMNWLKSQGFTITAEDGSRLSVFVKGTVAQIESSLQTSFVIVHVDGIDYPVADVAPSLPESVSGPVLGINGLDTSHRLHTHSTKMMQPEETVTTFKVPDIKAIYDANSTGTTGAGQTIAILIDTFPLLTDLTTFWSDNSITTQSTSNVTEITVNSGSLDSRSGEETLDSEWTTGIAPNVKIRIYATGTLSDANLDKGIARIISDQKTDSTIQQMSISLGEGETYEGSSELTTDSNYFATLAAAGVSVFCSSGDAGSTPGTTGTDNGPLQVSYYASDPSVTGVGGTSIYASNDVRTSEVAWSGSGGGESVEFSKPSWQVGTGVPSGTGRYVPDVAMPADPYTGAFLVYSGKTEDIGGTSWSAPTWAGFCALINEARGKSTGMGLLNPSLYPLIGTSSFYDITSGSNAETSKAGGKYSATVGYDPVTGIGTPNVGVLLKALVGTVSTTPTITGFTPTSGPVGTSVTITGTNFSSVTSVTFNGAAASYTVNSTTSIAATVPTGATTGVIAVTTSSGTATSSSSFTVTTVTVPAPTISSFTPTSGPTGTSVTISGTNFTNASAVTFNGTSAAFTVSSATQIVATVPTGATSGTISVTTPGGTATSTGSFTVTTSGGTGTSVVISQVYGGGASGSTSYYAHDYIELFNPTASAVDLSTYSVQYASAGGTSYSLTKLTGSIAAGHYYLVSESGGNYGKTLPTPDASGSFEMAKGAGKVALVSKQTAITSKTSTGVVDYVGYGSTANAYEGSGPAPTLSSTTADFRAGNGATDTNNNAADFTAGTPNPRNSAD